MIHYITTHGIANSWVAAELVDMKGRGVPLTLHSMRRPDTVYDDSSLAGRLDEETERIYPLPILGMLVSIIAAPWLFRARFFSALANSLFSTRESSRARFAAIAHFFVACHWARGLRNRDVSLIHSQWIQSGGTIGWYGAWLLGKPFSFTGHAVDLFKDRVALGDKIESAAFIVSISKFHTDFYVENGAVPDKIHLAYCGIDMTEFEFRPREPSTAPLILSFGRLVEKKGFDDLISACHLLRGRGVEFRCEIAGSGPIEQQLKDQIQRLELRGLVNVTGNALLLSEIPAWLDSGRVYAQPCVWSQDKDVDGIPRSLMEAMAVGLPAISTRIAGIPDLVIDDVSGLLVEPRDVEALADGIERLLVDHELSARLARGARHLLEEQFNLETCLQPIEDLFRSYLVDQGSRSTPARLAQATSPNP